jgi:hypothetical protein
MTMGKLSTSAAGSSVPISIKQFRQILGEIMWSVSNDTSTISPDYDNIPLNIRDLYILLGRDCTLQEREQIIVFQILLYCE